MPDPSSHAYDTKRARLRRRHENQGVPDERADEAATEEMHREHPPHKEPPVDRAFGPKGER
jgi:hypothetical protein